MYFWPQDPEPFFGGTCFPPRDGARENRTGFLTLLRALPRLILRARAMPKKWPWAGWESYLDQPLTVTREEFGIRVL